MEGKFMEMTRQEEEKFLKAIEQSLNADLSKALKKLTSRAEEEFRGRENFIEILTGVDEAENFLPLEMGDSIFFANQPPLKEISLKGGEPKTLSSAPFFLCVPYEEFFSFLNKDYRGAGFTYQLKPNYRFVEAEKKFSRVARLYGVPLQIYSPYARRAVDVCIFGEVEDFDLKLAENNLADKLLMNKNFYWNVEIDSVRWDSLNSDGKFFEYRCEDDLSFVLPDSDNFKVRRENGQIIFLTPEEFPEKKPERIKILPVKNKIAPRILNKKRLRTQGDVEFVLSGLERDGYSCTFKSFGAAAGNIVRYSAEHEYFSLADENLLRAKNCLPSCTIKFRGEKNFLTDYANFVLKFLAENYPEFNWAGERDE